MALFSLLVCYICLGYVTAVFHGNYSCPDSCNCVSTAFCAGLTVDCSQKGLSSVPPAIPTDVRCLLLQRNNLTKIKASSFKSLMNLKHLDISYNKIASCEEEAFDGLHGLETLLLNDNIIYISDNETLPLGIFSQLYGLKVLWMFHNRWEYVAKGYRFDILQNMTNLTELRLDGLANNISFGSEYAALTELDTLAVFGNITVISNQTFAAFRNTAIKNLYIIQAGLRNIEPMGFSHFHQLSTLHIQDTNKLKPAKAANGWYGLQFTKIKELYLQGFLKRPDYTPISINADFFRHLNLTEIHTLYMERSFIGLIDWQMNVTFPNLQVLSLACNSLVPMSASFLLPNLSFPSSLQLLSLAYQTLYPLNTCPETLKEYKTPSFLKDINTSGALVRNNSGALSRSNFKNNAVTNYGTSNMKQLIPIRLPPNLKVLILKGTMTYLTFEKNDIAVVWGGHKSLIIDGSQNNIPKANGQFLFLPPTDRFISLNWRSNGIIELSNNILTQSIKKGVNILQLDLFNNNLGNQVGRDDKGKTFGAYRNLKNLNLGHNAIRHLTQSIFKGLEAIENLNLTLNSLMYISFNLSALKNLKSLDISNNLISSLDQSSMNLLDAHYNTYNTNLTVYLEGNPLLCACDTLPFLYWIRKTKCIHDYSQLECSLKGEIVKFSDFYDDRFSKLIKQCNSQTYVTAAAISTVCIIVILAISYCLYIQRWNVKFICLNIVGKRKKYQAFMERNANKKYDAFVACHQNDIHWVKNELLPNLERTYQDENNSEQRFKLCLHQRDFIPGTNIEENIIESINNSRMTILVLSKSFVTSGWCDFEMQMAKLRCFKEGLDLILVIMLEEVAAQDMSKSLGTLISRNTYIPWDSGNQREEFWNRIRGVLKAPSAFPYKCECGHVIN